MRCTPTIGVLALVAAATACAGCAHPFTALASHTVPAGEMDVVWVLRDNTRIFRCVETASGPLCTEAVIATR